VNQVLASSLDLPTSKQAQLVSSSWYNIGRKHLLSNRRCCMNLSCALLDSQSPKLEDIRYLNCSECVLDCSALNAREIERILKQYGPKML
jgi:hypothetical protein